MARKPKLSEGSPAPVSLKIRLSPETLKVLRHEAVDRACSVSQVITDLVASAPSRLVVSRRSKGSDGAGSPTSSRAPGGSPSAVTGESAGADGRVAPVVAGDSPRVLSVLREVG